MYDKAHTPHFEKRIFQWPLESRARVLESALAINITWKSNWGPAARAPNTFGQIISNGSSR